MNRFQDKNVMVTGAASGIGEATAARLAEEGARVVCVDLNDDGLAKTVATIEEKGGQAFAVNCDISNPDSVANAVTDAVKQTEKLHGLCNVAGILSSGHSHEVGIEEWNRIISINLTGTFLMCQACIPHLLETKGNIVNTSSSAALGGHPWMAAYAASKGGILSLTKCLALEYVEQGLNVNAVIPGAIITPLHEGFQMPKGANANLIKRIIPFVPYAQPDVVASTIAFLASEEANYINGSELRVDGGMLT
jgi:NAD(P)-dependent dehydrogenase (short-subunit alcohol dehydrogenase family)